MLQISDTAPLKSMPIAVNSKTNIEHDHGARRKTIADLFLLSRLFIVRSQWAGHLHL